jgi:hypothetical protein
LRIQRLFFAGLVLGVLVVSVVLVHNYFTEPFPGHNDFLTPWEAVRTFAVDGYSPYSEQAGLNIQHIIFGRPAVEGENLGHYSYPFHASFLFWPLVYMPFSWATAVWMVILMFLLVVSLFLSLDLYGWKPRPVLLGVLVMWCLLWYPAARGLILGQIGLAIYGVQIFAIWALFRRRDVLCGAALAVSTMKPQMAFLLIPFLLLWALKIGRWRLPAAFAATFAALMLLAFMLYPAWVTDWFNRMAGYTTYNIPGPVWVLTNYYLGLGRPGEYGLSLLLAVGMLWAWYTVLVQGRQERFLWAVCLTFTITHLIAPSTATPHFVLFTLPLVFYLSELVRRQRRIGGWLAILVLMALLVLPWSHFLLTIEGDQEHPIMFLPMPMLMLAALWFTRHLWWQKAPVPAIEQPEAQPVGSAGIRGVSA